MMISMTDKVMCFGEFFKSIFDHITHHDHACMHVENSNPKITLSSCGNHDFVASRNAGGVGSSKLCQEKLDFNPDTYFD